MTSYVAADLRRLVESRANYLCEYCLIHKQDTYFGCQVDHIIAEKHGGPTNEDNLCLACSICNRAKGADIGSIAVSTGEFTRLYNPRTDRWTDHFHLDDIVIESRSVIGEATIAILGFNQEERIIEREVLRSVGRYPSKAALAHLD